MTLPDARAHWEGVYTSRPPDSVSWYQAEPTTSLALIETAAPPGAAILDVGGGTSLLVDALLARGYRPGVLDIADAALRVSRARLGERASEVEWFHGDVTTFRSPHPWDVWHDRAVFHFLTDAGARSAYRDVAARSVRTGGCLVIATFALTGPERCSGLSVVRYDAERLSEEMGPDFVLTEQQAEAHRTPDGRQQDFLYCVFRRSG